MNKKLRDKVKRMIISKTSIWASLLVVAVILISGCEPVSDVDSSQQVAGKTLCLSDYAQCIDPIFHTQMLGANGAITCSSAGCHDVSAGSGGGFKLFQSPLPDSVDMLANFYTARSFANLNVAENSKLQLEPLTGTFSVTGSHTGGDIYMDINDECYQSILSWINKQVDNKDSDSCGACTAPNLASCGY